MDVIYQSVFILGYILLVPSLAAFWYSGGRRMERVQIRSLWLMGLGLALILLAAQPYR